MIVKSTIRKKRERGRWNFIVMAASRAPKGTAIVVEGLDRETMHSAAESIRHRKGSDLIATEYQGLLIAYKPSKEFWERFDER